MTEETHQQPEDQEKLIAELRPKAERLEKLEARLQGALETRLAAIPEAHQEAITRVLEVIPAPEDKLDALEAQLAVLKAAGAKAAAPRMNAGEGGGPKRGGEVNLDDLTPGQRALVERARAGGYVQDLKGLLERFKG